MTQLKPHPLLFSTQQLVIDLALINRNHHLAGHERSENDIEHSFAVAMLCWFIHDTYNIPLDMEKVLKYALVHDFPERYAGDVNTYASDEARAKKVELEKAATDRLDKEFKDFPDLMTHIRNYEIKPDEESLFVWTVDKMQAIILGDMDQWRPYQKISITYDQFVEKHSGQIAHASPYCKEIFEALLEYSKTTFYDRRHKD